MATKKHHRTKTKLNIDNNVWIIIAAVALLFIIGSTSQVRGWLSRPAPAAGYIVSPSFAHLNPVAPNNTTMFICKYLEKPCNGIWKVSSPDAGTFDPYIYGKFTASANLGAYKVWAEDVFGNWKSNEVPVVIANNFYPVNLERTGTGGVDGNRFVFQPIILKWDANPGTEYSGIKYKITYKRGWTGKSVTVSIGSATSFTLPSDIIESFADGDWFWTVSADIDGIIYNQPYPQYDASLKIDKTTATNFLVPVPDKCKSIPPYIIHKPQQVLSWEPIDGAERYAIRLGIGNASGPYWYAVSIYGAGINIIKPLYDLLPNHTYLYLSLSGTALPGVQNINNLNYKGLSYGTTCPVYVDKE
ncbi:MAG: hypothetical protein V1807_00560 [Patescibacteria group bacterium]